jgi:hypothetical protein
MSKIDLYCEDGTSRRYMLGRNGNNPLYVIALNPSVATTDIFDQTVLKAFGLANIQGYDGCIFFNLIPHRDKNSTNLPDKYDKQYIDRNAKEIAGQIDKSNLNKIDILACWGESLSAKKYLQLSLKKICQELDKRNDLTVNWFCLKDTKSGNILTEKGHPRHLSYLKETTFLQKFDLEKYIKNI